MTYNGTKQNPINTVERQNSEPKGKTRDVIEKGPFQLWGGGGLHGNLILENETTVDVRIWLGARCFRKFIRRFGKQVYLIWKRKDQRVTSNILGSRYN